MEGSESAEILESLNFLNPQIFINETLNTVDDLLDDAFDFFHQEAATLLKPDGTDESQTLTEGIAYIHNMMQSELDNRLEMWEKYCIHHCFAIPKGFSLPQSKESPDESAMCQDILSDPDLDAQLDSLRNKLTVLGKESADLNRELQALERQSASKDRCAAAVAEALQLYGQNSANEMFQDLVRTASELRTKMEKLRSRRKEDAECIRTKRIFDPNRYLFATSNHSRGLSAAELEDLHRFMADIKNI